MNEGAAVVRAYNVLKYDAGGDRQSRVRLRAGRARRPRRAAPGDDPRGALKARAAEARFPFLAANLVDAATGAPPAWPTSPRTTMVEVAGVKVGIIGLANAGTAFMTLPANFAGLRALPLAPAVVAAAKDLRRRGATAVIVVAHVGGSCTRFTAIRRSRVVRIRRRDLPARARAARRAPSTRSSPATRTPGSPTASPASRSSRRTTRATASDASTCRSSIARVAGPARRWSTRKIFPPAGGPEAGAAVRRHRTKARRWHPTPPSRPRSRPRWPPRAPGARRRWA